MFWCLIAHFFKKLILLFSKNPLNWSKVTVKTLFYKLFISNMFYWIFYSSKNLEKKVVFFFYKIYSKYNRNWMLKGLLRQRTEYFMHITKHKYYIDGSKPSRLLALTLKKHEQCFNIQAIKSSKSGFTSHPTDINKTFKGFFEKLNTSETRPNVDQLNSFFW